MKGQEAEGGGSHSDGVAAEGGGGGGRKRRKVAIGEEESRSHWNVVVCWFNQCTLLPALHKNKNKKKIMVLCYWKELVWLFSFILREHILGFNGKISY